MCRPSTVSEESAHFLLYPLQVGEAGAIDEFVQDARRDQGRIFMATICAQRQRDLERGLVVGFGEIVNA